MKGFIFFILWPFGSFLYAIIKFHRKNSKTIIYLFLVLFGLTFILGNDDLDSYHYAAYFQEMASKSFQDFKLIITNFLASEKSLDLAQPIISFVLSRLTDDYRLFFGGIAAIFGYFYIRSINVIHRKYYTNKNSLALLFLLFFILIINPIFNINGFRFYTATWIYFLGTYKLITTKNKKYFALCSLSVLFHFSFFIPIFILIIYLIIGNRNRFYFTLLILSFFISDVIFNIFPSISSIFGEGLSSKAGRYVNQNTIENIQKHKEMALRENKWYLYLPGTLTFYYITFSFLFINYKYKNFVKSSELKNLFSFSLLFLSFANATSFIPSMGRFRSVFLLFGLAFIINLLSNFYNGMKNKTLFIIGIPIFCLNLITVLRLGFDIINPWLFTLLPLPFGYNDVSIYQWLFD